MRVFVTGASGWIGSAVVPELIGAGHEVVGLARSEPSAERLIEAGAKAHRGSLDDLDSLRDGAADADGVIHLAFIHDFSQFEASVGADRRAIETLGDALEGTGRPLVIASGLLGLAPGRVATETDMPGPDSPRAAAAATTLALAERDVRSSVVRLPPTVHGKGDKGFVPMLIATARRHGVSGYVAEGANRWSAVHRLDAARLFRLAVEKGPAASVFHAVGDEGVPTRAIAEVIGRHLDVPVTAIAPDDVVSHFGWIGPLFALDGAASSAQTEAQLGWRATQPGLVDDLDAGHYFEQDARS